jgi:hypothetical protein
VERSQSTFTTDITPLILAAHMNNYEIIKILLDRGASLPSPHDVRLAPSACNPWDRQPVRSSCLVSCMPAAKKLLEWLLYATGVSLVRSRLQLSITAGALIAKCKKHSSTQKISSMRKFYLKQFMMGSYVVFALTINVHQYFCVFNILQRDKPINLACILCV